MVIRRGVSSLGCLVSLLVVAAAVYFCIGVGEHYWRFYEYQDGMRQEVKFAAHNSDAVILRHLGAQVDSLGLPESAAEVVIQRDGRHIAMESDYYQHIELPLVVRELHFNPHAAGLF